MEGKLQYKLTNDINGNPLDGSRNYLFHLPPDMPAANFWSVIGYDIKTQLIIHNGQAWPSVHSNCKKLVLNPDNSVDIWFGPKAPDRKSGNWIQTIPGKAWYMVFQLYDLQEPLSDLAWSPGEILEII